MHKEILVVGSVNMDMLLMTPRLPQPGETMFSEKYFFNPGGKGANQVVAVSKLGGRGVFAGKVGNDDFAVSLRRTLEEYGVCCDFLTVSHTSPSGFAVIMLEENGQNRIIVHPAANFDITKADIEVAFKRDYMGMIIQFEISPEIAIYACQKAREKGIPIIVDAGPPPSFSLEKIQGIEILTPNETETTAICGIELHTEGDYKNAAKIMAAQSGAKYVVLKLGAKGSCLYTNGEIRLFPAYDVKAVDSTAAGDAFTAAMAVQYLETGDIEKAITYATAAGALTVTKPGAQQSIPTKAEVEAFIRQSHK